MGGNEAGDAEKSVDGACGGRGICAGIENDGDDAASEATSNEACSAVDIEPRWCEEDASWFSCSAVRTGGVSMRETRGGEEDGEAEGEAVGDDEGVDDDLVRPRLESFFLI